MFANGTPRLLMLRARLHETRCQECRVTWRSWAARWLTEWKPVGS